MTIKTLQVGPIMTNCYLLCDEDAKVCALIDPGDDESQIEKLVGQSGCVLKYILLTHGHFDHTSAVRPLLERYPDVFLPNSSAGKVLTRTIMDRNPAAVDWSGSYIHFQSLRSYAYYKFIKNKESL